MANYFLRRNNNYDLFDAFNSLFTPSVFNERSDVMKTDFKETEKGFLLEVELAGFDKNDIELSFEKGYLTISAEKKLTEDEGEKYLRRERVTKLSRTYYAGDIDKDQIKAKYENGVLSVDLPKKEKALPESNRIAIE